MPGSLQHEPDRQSPGHAFLAGPPLLCQFWKLLDAEAGEREPPALLRSRPSQDTAVSSSLDWELGGVFKGDILSFGETRPGGTLVK